MAGDFVLLDGCKVGVMFAKRLGGLLARWAGIVESETWVVVDRLLHIPCTQYTVHSRGGEGGKVGFVCAVGSESIFKAASAWHNEGRGRGVLVV